MSRSYRKFPSDQCSEYWGPDWRCIRTKERQCIHEEMRTPEKGDIIFPRYHATGDGSWSSSSRFYYPKKRVWDKYTTEIRNILNGYSDHYDDFEDDFLIDFNHIRVFKYYDGVLLHFDWLKSKEAKRIIKAWEGKPLDVLYCLNSHRIIEKAAQHALNRMVRK
ncbi:hypothetical protein [Treponema primitia]|uniref:hypothetical protein n=1 Tax=Treponema primitia TaxID=88058 RepID=UPI000474A49B|nr:hypothetical protein [Treponema primitia]